MKKCIFIHIPKNAGTAIKKSLSEKIKFDYRLNGHKRIDNRMFSKKLHYFKFAFVRNPWDRLVSAYFNLTETRRHKKIFKGRSFKQFIIDLPNEKSLRNYLHMRPQISWITYKGKIIMDFIGRYEKLQEDFNKVCDMIEIDSYQLPLIRKSEHSDYHTYYNENMIEIVRNLYKADIEAFGYSYK